MNVLADVSVIEVVAGLVTCVHMHTQLTTLSFRACWPKAVLCTLVSYFCYYVATTFDSRHTVYLP